MRRPRIAAFIFLVPLLGIHSREIHAAPILGSQVTGALFIDGDIPNTNRFDPLNKTKTPTGFANIDGATVTITSPKVEFGYLGTISTFTADFTGDKLVIAFSTSNGSKGFTMVFNDDAFFGATLAKESDSFINGGLTGGVAGNTITVTWAGSLGVRQNGTTTATFGLSPVADSAPSPTLTVPEPTSLLLFTFVSAACVIAVTRSRRSH